ncbi:serine/threonine-protein kinase [Nocardiopsis ansamitocini]|uniref:Protein kinase domain-containing protein n=1 Tax=Nocardiopsis ansamitocini TaxID=1670832 RepID=A0A9W6P6N1_9ACTN|nr:serine/threonine-protein kinase [Nocardiopsis ansamitocini]GLU48116.1 hypothetical protein Nans01_24670 [Nocardiopsis ansamitocini]
MSRRSERTISVLVPPDLGPIAPEDPQAIGPYVLVGRFGSGRTGTVYAAVNPAAGTDSLLAVKTLPPARVADRNARAELDRRLRALAGVDGRCYVAPVTFDSAGDPPWLAMPYASGIPLAQYARKRGPLTPGRLIALAAGLAEGLCSLHAHGLSHGDLTPSNILLSSTGPRILDCSLPGDPESLRRSAAWLGPERHHGAAPSPASDAFAWGAIISFAATGRLPFGMGEPAVLAARVESEAPDLEGVPSELRPLLESALAKDPAERPDGQELLRASIQLWEEGLGTVGTEAGPGTGVTRLLNREWQGIVEPALLPRVVHLNERGKGKTGKAAAKTSALRPAASTATASAAKAPRSRALLLTGSAVLGAVLLGGAAWAGVAAFGGGLGTAAPLPSPSPSPSSSPTPPPPLDSGTMMVRFDGPAENNLLAGPWPYTPVQEVDPDAGLPSSEEIVTPQEWSARWTPVEGAEEPLEALIAADAEVLCAHFCLAAGQVYTDEQNRGTYTVTGRDLVNYLSWGDVVIAEATFGEPDPETGTPSIIQVTEVYPPAP